MYENIYIIIFDIYICVNNIVFDGLISETNYENEEE